MAEAEQLAEALDTRRDVLAEQFNNLEKEQAAPTTAEIEPEAQKPDRARDEAGKFATTDKAIEKTAKVAPVVRSEIAPEPVKADPPWKAKPPQSWKKDYHEIWQTLPDNVREYTWQREEQMKAGVQPLLSKAEFADEMNKVIEPYANTMRGLNISPSQAIKGFFEADNILRNSPPQQKLAYLVQIAQNYGVDLSQLTGAAQNAPPVDPNYHALLNELNNVKGQVKTWQEQQEAVANQALQGEIEKFAQAHEHFETVRPIMSSLLQSGQAKTLDEAYRKAVRLDDTLFDAEIVARQAQSVEAKDKAAKSARAAAVSVRGSAPGSHTATNAKASRREMLAEQFSSIDSRL